MGFRVRGLEFDLAERSRKIGQEWNYRTEHLDRMIADAQQHCDTLYAEACEIAAELRVEHGEA